MDQETADKRREARLKYQKTDKGRATARRKERKKYNDPNHREKFQARWALRSAVRRGKITRGTCHCGKVGHGHHEDYSKPLDVMWLCDEHHEERHEEISRIEHPNGCVGSYNREV